MSPYGATGPLQKVTFPMSWSADIKKTEKKERSFNSLAPGRCGTHFKSAISEYVIMD